MSDHSITVKPDGLGFALYDREAICGDRLFKGDGKTKAELWPFKGSKWWLFDERAPAEKAAKRLQTYLDAREPKLGK